MSWSSSEKACTSSPGHRLATGMACRLHISVADLKSVFFLISKLRACKLYYWEVGTMLINWMISYVVAVYEINEC
jgi:hypothetical protein